ncbi:MAG: 4'-phosphopantetheinyl transferase superfamily protein [Gemmatimonadota bacterium]
MSAEPSEDPWELRTHLSAESYVLASAGRAISTTAERERAGRLRRSGDGARYLAAHGALRLILAGYLGHDPHDVRFEAGPRGKPSVVGGALQFNLSHSGAIALIAVAKERPVGVDVERQRSIVDLEGIVERICTPRERAALDAVPPSKREGAFLAMWTRKEALAKMTGDGFRALSRDASLGLQVDCRLEPLDDLPGYAACVAAQGTDWRLVRRP